MPAGGNSRFRGYPARMSERQQLALLLQMTSQEIVSGETDRNFVVNKHTHNYSISMQKHVIDHRTIFIRIIYAYILLSMEWFRHIRMGYLFHIYTDLRS